MIAADHHAGVSKQVFMDIDGIFSCAEPALVSDLGHNLENTDDDSAPRNEENSSDIRQESSEAGNGLQDVPSEVPHAVTNELRMQLEDGTSISVEPVAEVSAVVSDDPVVSPHGYDDPSSSRGEETRDALQGGEVSGEFLLLIFLYKVCLIRISAQSTAFGDVSRAGC